MENYDELEQQFTCLSGNAEEGSFYDLLNQFSIFSSTYSDTLNKGEYPDKERQDNLKNCYIAIFLNGFQQNKVRSDRRTITCTTFTRATINW